MNRHGQIFSSYQSFINHNSHFRATVYERYNTECPGIEHFCVTACATNFRVQLHLELNLSRCGGRDTQSASRRSTHYPTIKQVCVAGCVAKADATIRDQRVEN